MAAGRTAQAIALAAQAGVQIDTTRGATPARSRTSVLQLLRVLFSAQFRRVTIVLPAVGFFGVLLAYGLSTWLPELLRQSGYSLGSALTFLLALNVGQLTLSRLADRFGARTTIATAFAGAGLCVLAISTGLPGAAVFALVLAAGFGALTSQSLLFGYAGMLYPAAVRGSGLGWVMGLSRVGGICGPIVGAFLLSGYGISASFYGFAAAAVSSQPRMPRRPRRPIRHRPRASSPDRPGARPARGCARDPPRWPCRSSRCGQAPGRPGRG
jgi:AAHS family benzoate transporter-like MFS transporter